MNPLIADIANNLGLSDLYNRNQQAVDSVANTLEQSGAQNQAAFDAQEFQRATSPNNIDKAITQRKQGVIDRGIMAGGGPQ